MEHLEKIQDRIYEVRGERVMLDFDLAALYQVETRVLKQAVRRNLDRFPEDFLFRLTPEESNLLIYNGVKQIVIPLWIQSWGAEMFAVTEQGGGNWLIISLRSQFVTSNEWTDSANCC